MNKEQFLQSGSELNIPSEVIEWAVVNSELSSSVLQSLADQQALMSGSCSTPRPKPKFIPGYWECVGGSWLWVAGV